MEFDGILLNSSRHMRDPSDADRNVNGSWGVLAAFYTATKVQYMAP